MSDFDQFRADLRGEKKRLESLSAEKLDAKKELVRTVLPLFEALVQHVEANLADTEASLTELLTGGESLIQPELGARILATFEAGAQLVLQLQQEPVSDLAAQLATQFQGLIAETTLAVQEAVAEYEDAEDDNDDEDEDGEGADEDAKPSAPAPVSPDAQILKLSPPVEGEA
jgi:hypothetical protein